MRIANLCVASIVYKIHLFTILLIHADKWSMYRHGYSAVCNRRSFVIESSRLERETAADKISRRCNRRRSDWWRSMV